VHSPAALLARWKGSSPQSCGRAFTEHLAVKIPESQFCRDVSYSCGTGFGLLQSTICQMHAAKQHVLHGADPELLLAGDAQGPAGSADYLTDLVNRPRHERMRIHDLAEAADDEAMMSHGRGVSAGACQVNALQHGVS
jgi:hypothetical protein